MQDSMLGKIIRMLVTVPAEWFGTLADLLEKAVSSQAAMWLTELKRFLRKEACWLMIQHDLVRVVDVNIICAPQEALNTTGRRQYTNDTVVINMPKGKGGKTEVVFFRPEPWEYTHPLWMSDDDLEKCYERRALNPVDPYSLAAVNEADPAFTVRKSNATHWKDASGRWCFAAFSLGGKDVFVDSYDQKWDHTTQFGGLHK